jgi:Protein of unknown function (DUF2752)
VTWNRLLSVLGLAASIAVLAYAFTLKPDPRGYGTHEQLGLPPCGFLRDHGVPCISCGMTTAFAAMAHGDLALALRSNPYGILLFLAVLATPFHCLHSLIKDWDPFWILRHRRATVILPLAGLLLLVNWGVMVLVAKAGS